MRSWPAPVAVFSLFASVTLAGDGTETSTLPRHATREALLHAIAERICFQSLSIDLPPSPPEIVVRPGHSLIPRNHLITQLGRLDQLLAQRQALRETSDADLRATWAALEDNSTQEPGQVLVEIATRPRPALKSLVSSAIRAARRESRWSKFELSLQAVERRLEGKVAPIAFRVSAPDSSEFAALPTIEALAFDVDEGGRELRPHTFARPAGLNFHLEIREEGGRILPVNEYQRGEWIQRKTPHIRDDSVVVLSIADFVHPLHPVLPGEYSIVLHYSDAMSIDAADSYLHTFTLASDPIKMTVVARRVSSTESEQTRLALIATELPTESEVDVFLRGYGPWAHSQVAPDSVPGRLLDAGWAAVPALVRMVSDRAQPGTRRAWGFAVLHGITGLLNPLQVDGALEAADVHRDRLHVGRLTGSTIDASVQDLLAASWARQLEGLEIRLSK